MGCGTVRHLVYNDSYIPEKYKCCSAGLEVAWNAALFRDDWLTASFTKTVRGLMNDLTVQKNQPNEERLVHLQYDWLRGFIGAMSAFQLYPPVHPKAQAALDLLLQVTLALHEAYDGELSLSYGEKGVLINNFSIDPTITAFHRLGEELHNRHIHSLIFSQGMERAELEKCMTFFSLPAQRVIERGGLALLLEETGVHHIRPAMLRYAERSTQKDDLGTPDRVLFARMEECLLYGAGRGNGMGSGNGESAAEVVVAFLENPKITARYLEQKITATETNPNFVGEVVAALEKAGTLVYTKNPAAWNQSKQNMAEALYLLSPVLREKTLEVACRKSTGSSVLEEIVAALQPDQIASILTDTLTRDYTQDG
ncbi:TPA: hypothetical protein DDW35_06860, partial [Candidatus Sumerlaeota bacterium]|nr:hypothetical protein [Candidatus Sumerlaeota bacterium]